MLISFAHAAVTGTLFIRLTYFSYTHVFIIFSIVITFNHFFFS